MPRWHIESRSPASLNSLCLLPIISPTNIVILLGSSVAAGAINSVAGGGSFFTFPALIFAGLPSIAANATSTMGVWPGSLASVAAYRKEIRREARRLPGLLVMSILGGVLGAGILLKTPQATFDRVLPWLLLFATLSFAFGGKLTAWLRPASTASAPEARPRGFGIVTLLLQLFIAIYAGYFGGGAGILMLAMLALAGMTEIHAMNGIKTLLATVANLIALITFISAGLVAWPQALLMMVGSTCGGYGGAHFARKVNPKIIKQFVIAFGAVLTVYFFFRSR